MTDPSTDAVDTESRLVRGLVADVQARQASLVTCTCPTCAPRTAALTLLHALRALQHTDQETLDYWGLDASQEGYGLLAHTLRKEYDL